MMVVPSVQEHRSFFAYIFSTILTSICLALGLPQIWLSALVMLWGVFGFYRYMYLISLDGSSLPKVRTLPSRILFGLKDAQETQINLSLDRFFTKDVWVFFIAGAVFVLWGGYCTLYPLERSLLDVYLHDKQEVLLIDLVVGVPYYSILEKISFYFMMALLFFTGLTFGYHHFVTPFLKVISLALLSIFLGYIVLSLSPILIGQGNDFTYLKGGGWGQFFTFENLLPVEITQKGKSNFIIRYVETGLIGAWGLHVLFVPLLYSIVRQVVMGRGKGGAALLFILLLSLAVLDFFWISHPFIAGYNFLIVSCSAYLWGRCCPSQV